MTSALLAAPENSLPDFGDPYSFILSSLPPAPDGLVSMPFSFLHVPLSRLRYPCPFSKYFAPKLRNYLL